MAEYQEEQDHFIGVPEAIEIADKLGIIVTTPTAIKWIAAHFLGHQPGKMKGTHWLVNKRRWEDFITGKWQEPMKPLIKELPKRIKEKKNGLR